MLISRTRGKSSSYETDLAFVATFRGATSRLGVALHLGLLRYLGYLPDAWVVNMPTELRAFAAG